MGIGKHIQGLPVYGKSWDNCMIWKFWTEWRIDWILVMIRRRGRVIVGRVARRKKRNRRGGRVGEGMRADGGGSLSYLMMNMGRYVLREVGGRKKNSNGADRVLYAPLLHPKNHPSLLPPQHEKESEAKQPSGDLVPQK